MGLRFKGNLQTSEFLYIPIEKGHAMVHEKHWKDTWDYIMGNMCESCGVHSVSLRGFMELFAKKMLWLVNVVWA